MDNPFRKPTIHKMKRRSYAHDYSWKGCYHITISTAKAMRQPLGYIAGSLDKPDGDSDAPHVELSAVGRMVEQELVESIHRYYPMLEVVEYVVMPEHLHFLLMAHSNVVSQSGKATHLGHVIAGFKLGCNKRFWAMTGRIAPESQSPAPQGPATESPGTLPAAAPALAAAPAALAAAPAAQHPAPAAAPASQHPAPIAATAGPLLPASALGDSVAKHSAAPPPVAKHPASGGALPPLFDKGYCDVMPVDEAQLATQRQYIRANPRNRLMRVMHRSWLFPQRRTVDTAVSLSALRGYLQRERALSLTADSFTLVSQRLLKDQGRVVCDSYGNLDLLSHRLLPVVCHRKDAALFEQQKARCMEAAASGAVLVSARIAKGEQEILDQALRSGYPVIRMEDNGFPDIYHPSADRMDDCAAGNLLLLTPWAYQFQRQEEQITVTFCKTMNCLCQAVCRQKDAWWKEV